jgi:hypothetical protein
MNDLLNLVLTAHGGLERWNAFDKVSVTVVTGGELWAMKGIQMDAFARRASAAIHEEWSTVTPFGNPDWTMTFVPGRLVVEDRARHIVAERDNPSAAFAGHALNTPWDRLHRAYFNGYALWTYLTTPFLLALAGVEVREVAPWDENGETWRVLRASFPPAIATHSREQDFYFGPDFLLRRHDYQVDIAGGLPAAQYVYDMQEFDGIMFPTKRRAHPRLDNGQPARETVLVSIDLADYKMEAAR